MCLPALARLPPFSRDGRPVPLRRAEPRGAELSASRRAARGGGRRAGGESAADWRSATPRGGGAGRSRAGGRSSQGWRGRGRPGVCPQDALQGACLALLFDFGGFLGFGGFWPEFPPAPRRYRASWACGRSFIRVKVQVFAPMQGSVSGPQSIKHGLSAAAVPPARGKGGITLALSPAGQHLLCVLATWYEPCYAQLKKERQLVPFPMPYPLKSPGGQFCL